MIKQFFYFLLGLFLYVSAYNSREEGGSASIFFLVGSVCIYSVFNSVRSDLKRRKRETAGTEEDSPPS